MKHHGLLIAGKWILTDEKISVMNKATGNEIGFISVAGEVAGKGCD